MSACSIYSGKKYTNAEIRVFARQAGWPEFLIPIVAAVSLAESGGDPGAMNVCGEHSVGLLQINQDAHNYPTTTLTNPVNNLKIAYDIYAGKNGNKAEGAGAWVNSWVRGGWKKYAVGDEAPGVPAGPGGSTPGAQTVGLKDGGGISSYLGMGWLFGTVADGDTLYKSAQANGYKATGKQRYLIATAIIVLIVAFAWGKF